MNNISEIFDDSFKKDVNALIKKGIMDMKKEMPKGSVYTSSKKPPKGAQVFRTARGTEYWVPSKKDKEDKPKATVDSSTGISPDSDIGRNIQYKTMAAGMEGLLAGSEAFQEAGGHDAVNKTAALKAARRAHDAVTKKFENTSGINFRPENIDKYYESFDNLVSMPSAQTGQKRKEDKKAGQAKPKK